MKHEEATMATTSRMRAALDRLDDCRVQIEAAIIADLERKFFTDPTPAVIPHALDDSDNPTTECDSPFTFAVT
jgi:hypothetical protein